MSEAATETSETSETSDLVTRGETGVALPMQALYAEQGSGMEEMGSEDFTVPYLSIVQPTSAYLKKNESAYIEEAEEGMFVNTLSDEVYSGTDGLLVVPCYFRAVYTEQKPGKNGKFVTEHPVSFPDADKTTRNEHGQDVLQNGNVLIRKNRHYLMLAHEGEPVILTCKSTSLKVSKKLNTLLAGRKMKTAEGQEFTPPIFSSVWRLTTTFEKNDDGSWFNPKFEPVGDLQDESLFQRCREFASMVRGGDVREEGDEG